MHKCMLKVNTHIGLEDHLDKTGKQQEQTATLTHHTHTHTHCSVSHPCLEHRQTTLNAFLGQHCKQGIMGLTCCLPGVCTTASSWPLTSQSWSLKEHLTLRCSARLSQGKRISERGSADALLQRTTLISMWVSEKVTALTFPLVLRMSWIWHNPLNRNPLRNTIQDYLLKRSNPDAGGKKAQV